MRVLPGRYVWGPAVRVRAGGAGARDVAAQLRTFLAENRVAATIASAGADAGVVLVTSNAADARLGAEGYVLRVRPSGVTIRANTARGLFYGLQTLQQISSRSSQGLVSQAVEIVDRPEYRWRGIHLDVARHFFAVSVIERFIGAAAHYKLNVFHWHLTDDQAWRLQSAHYPALASRGASYSAADVREVVTYAARRYVTVVPEIDMPAHTGAALRAYPRLACAGGTLCTTGAGLDFARNVLDDVTAEFPSRYVHVGGDEVPSSARAAQSRFTRALDAHLSRRGRRTVGWSEIVAPDLPPRTIVTVWTDPQLAARVAHRGNDVVVAVAPLYFDAAQGDAAQEPRASPHMSTLERVYEDVVMPDGVSARDAAHVLGAQAQLWTEHIASPDRLFRMTFPRELAFAEVVWTPRRRKTWASFLDRLPAQFAWLENHGYPFRIPNASFAISGGAAAFTAVPGHVQSVDAWTASPRLTVALRVPLEGADVRYTRDGSAPSGGSPRCRGLFFVRTGTAPIVLRAATFVRGHRGAVTTCTIRREPLRAVHAHRHASTSWSALVSP
ncbi:MAG: hypothetical protein NVS3B7_16630 [Candidatus Elarobacter sp.]